MLDLYCCIKFDSGLHFNFAENSWMASGNGSSSPVASSSPLLLLRVHHHQLPRTTLLRKESEKKVKQPSFQQQENEEEFGVVFEAAESSLAHQLQMCRGELQYMVSECMESNWQ
jgi:hypothetical protein